MFSEMNRKGYSLQTPWRVEEKCAL